jgi:glutamyl-tRNA reductase
MRPNPNESYESWSERVTMYEKGRALQRLANGDPVETVLEDMGRRIMEKMLDPIFRAIKDSAKTDYDPKASLAHYKEVMKHHGPAADHVEGNLFDKPE